MRNKLILSIALLSLLPSIASSQDVREANFQFKQENYQLALKLYLGAFKKDTGNVDYNYAIGICRVKTNSAPSEALPHLLKAEKKYGQESEFLMALSYAYLYNYDFENARATLKKAEAKLKGSPDIALLNTYIDNAEKMVKSPLDVTFVNMGKSFNSEMDETTPMLSADGEMLFYTTNRKFDPAIKIFTPDIYYSIVESGDFKKSRPVAINSPDDEYLAGLSNSGEELYFRLDGEDAWEDLVVSKIENKTLKGKTPFPATVNSKELENGAYSTASGDTLYFSSNRSGGFGGSDLYYSVRLPNGDWSPAVNLGNQINSAYDETFPMLSADGTKFYFSSNGENSMGGFDVFVCDINAKTGEIGTPKNIGYPLNDAFDNMTISYSPDGNYAYVSAIKPDSYGYADIYRVVFNDKDPMVRMYLVKLVTQQGDQTADFGETERNLKVTVFTKNKTIYGTYNYNPTASQVPVALLPGSYTLEIEGETIEPFSMKINVPNAPGKPIENIKAVVKPKK